MKITKILALLLALIMLTLPMMVSCNDEDVEDPQDYNPEENNGGGNSGGSGSGGSGGNEMSEEERLVEEYKAYLAMEPDEQLAFYKSFPTGTDFFYWHDRAMKAYNDSKDDPVWDGNSDINLPS